MIVKLMLATVLLAAVLATNVYAVLTEEEVREFNLQPNRTWHARVYPWLVNATKKELLGRLGTRAPDPLKRALKADTFNVANVTQRKLTPMNMYHRAMKTYHVIDQWPQCSHTIKEIRDQGDCGCCWAIGSTMAMSDRNCIAGGGAIRLSHVDVMDCCKECSDDDVGGCDGGWPDIAYQFWGSIGVVSSKCKPEANSCRQKCKNGAKYLNDKHFGHQAGHITPNGEQAMKDELSAGGSITASYKVYEDFMDYSGGIYKHSYGEHVGWHAVRVLGWGEYKGTAYWTVANSWGADWGEKGTFRIVRGKNECKFESNVDAGSSR